MKLSFKEYQEKVSGCWMGKNIGGVLGAPFEGKRQVNHVDFYIQDLKGNPPANDDLDLQLVWLNAVEEYGRAVNANILGEYWLTYITPNWVEYGVGKNNLRMGIVPPLSGYLNNPYGNSCGCFIRSEIWACLAPGRPELAVRYAYEDAIVDHYGEGMYGELFIAAVQSAAFAESNTYKLIDIGLSYIPDDCGVSKAVQTAIKSYKSGRIWQEARADVLSAVPGTFGIQSTRLEDIPTDVPIGAPGYDAPSNIGIVVIGWLYGEGDWGKSLCIANNCGEDTDCTAATIGAILGIILGRNSIPLKWIEPIGDVINTCCINLLNGGIDIPKTVTELTDRILRMVPAFLGRKVCDLFAGPEGYTIDMQQGNELLCITEHPYLKGINGFGKPTDSLISELARSPFVVRQHFAIFDVELDYMGEPYIRMNEPKKIKLTFSNNQDNQNHQWMNIQWYSQEFVEILPNRECSFFLESTYNNHFETEFEIVATKTCGKVELLADISINGRHSDGIVKVVLLPRIN